MNEEFYPYRIAKADTKCFYSHKPIYRGEQYVEGILESEDGKEQDYIEIHPETAYLIDRLDMFGVGTDNDFFGPEDYDNLVKYAFEDLMGDDLISEEEAEEIISSNKPFAIHNIVFKKYQEKDKEESYVPSPIDVLLKFMVEEGLGMKKVATLLGIPLEELIEFLDDELYVDDDFAERLWLVTGKSPEYWLELQEAYDDLKAKHFAKRGEDVCPECGHSELKYVEKWDEEYGAYVVGVTVSCAHCGNIKHDSWYDDVYVENWVELYKLFYTGEE